jgi:hypothetical protein
MHNDNNAPAAQGIDRRTALKQLAIACGLALSTQSLSLMAASFTLPTDPSRKKNKSLNAQQLTLVRELGELIIPTTDTPGAIAADVHTFIDHQLAYCFNAQEQQAIFAGLAKLDAQAQAQHAAVFLACDKTKQIALLTDMEAARNGFDQDDRNFFKQFKALVVFGYYTSEIGATQELAYSAIPGGYKAIKFAEVGKAWALF